MEGFELGTFSLGSMFGIVIGAFIGHALAIRRGKFQVKHNAALELKKAFHPTLLKLRNGDSPTIIISAYFDKHQEAAMEYSGYLNGSALESYREAFNSYTFWYKTICNRSREDIMYGENDPVYLAEKVKKPEMLIGKILECANT